MRAFDPGTWFPRNIKSKKGRLFTEQRRLKQLEKTRLLGLETPNSLQEEFKILRRIAARQRLP